MYLHKRKCAVITLRIFEIVYVLNFSRSPVIKQMIQLIFFNNKFVVVMLTQVYRAIVLR